MRITEELPFAAFDIEANGLLDTVTKFHCGVIYDSAQDEYLKFRPMDFHKFYAHLELLVRQGYLLVAHNGIKYDIPAIVKLLGIPEWSFTPQFVDTLVLSRLIYSNVGDSWDAALIKANKLAGRLRGSHSLKAWGYRLGILKGNYAAETEDAWACFNEEMLDYCVQDVAVTVALFLKLREKNYSPRAIELEHKAAWLMAKQERNGFPFNTQAAIVLDETLKARYEVLHAELMQNAPAIPDKVFVPKRDNKKLGYVAGVAIQRYKEFNPGSRMQITWLLLNHFKYLPKNEELYEEKTDNDGDACMKLKLDDTTFSWIATDPDAGAEMNKFAAVLSEFFMIKKRLGQVSEGPNAWLKMVTPEGFIHGSVNPNGAVTGRATHSYPNLAQVPSSRAPYGGECRSLFGIGDRQDLKGWVQVGVDASGLELRCLAHFMFPFDHGQYAEVILNGDIHWVNCQAAGFIGGDIGRDKHDPYHEIVRGYAKTFIYAYLYGAGDEKIGKIIGKDAAAGKKIKAEFLKKTPALAGLREFITTSLVEEMTRGRVTKWKRRWLRGIDGRILHVRSLHAALNTLLQSAGGLICKYWIVRLEERLKALGLKHGWDGDFAYMAWVHDEVQIACREELAETVKREAQAAMRDTGAYFNFRVQLDTDGQVGKTWKDCH